MPQFLRLSKMVINFDNVRFVSLVPEKTTAGQGPGCMVYFIGSLEPYGFYGDDAKAILETLAAKSYKTELTSDIDCEESVPATA